MPGRASTRRTGRAAGAGADARGGGADHIGHRTAEWPDVADSLSAGLPRPTRGRRGARVQFEFDSVRRRFPILSRGAVVLHNAWAWSAGPPAGCGVDGRSTNGTNIISGWRWRANRKFGKHALAHPTCRSARSPAVAGVADLLAELSDVLHKASASGAREPSRSADCSAQCRSGSRRQPRHWKILKRDAIVASLTEPTSARPKAAARSACRGTIYRRSGSTAFMISRTRKGPDEDHLKLQAEGPCDPWRSSPAAPQAFVPRVCGK